MSEENKSYGAFAWVYDTFMDNLPYDAWCAFLWDKLREYQIENGLVLDLGCGTGSLTERFASRGYDMIGIDCSGDMLEIAMDKKAETGSDILYLLQDMREFELYGTVRAVYSCCDSLNYITEPEELLQVFRLVNNYLDPSGLFVFDFNTTYKYREVLGDNTIAESREDCGFIWENYFDEETYMNEYALTLFMQEENGFYSRYDEMHYQRGYTLEEIKGLLKKAGLVFLEAYDDYTNNPVHEKSERIVVLAMENGKAGRKEN